MKKFINDVKAMFWRCVLQTLRNPSALLVAVAIPAIIMMIFVFVFGGSMDVGDYNITNFLVPGVLVNVLVQSSQSTGINVNQDMTKGIINRFRSMAIANSAFLIGHLLAAFIKTIVTTTVTLGVAFLVGFRPTASFTEWLIIIGLIALFVLGVTWFSMWLGVSQPNAEEVGGYLALAAIVVFLSPGMAPTQNMPRFLRYFAENQPMAPFINAIRALMNGYDIAGNDLWLTLLWWGGITVAMFLLTVRSYKKKLTI
ncbi:MAG: ABC transporter permease [Turicibacter sp.]|nr:ABC transporter permease [Turicibacter sp.]